MPATVGTGEGLQGFSGSVLAPGDSGYDEARAVHNGMIDRRPALIAQCRNTADVIDAIGYARGAGLDISVRGGGHNVAGRAVADGALMIDLSTMKGIRVDPGARSARVQGGVLWRELNREAAVHGLATTGGAISTTGVAGLTLGGGLGWGMAKWGLAADNLTGVELVTGRRLRPRRHRGGRARPVLGAARRRRELRRRNVARVPPPRLCDGHRRADRASDRQGAGDAPLLPRRDRGRVR